jgi:type IV pilus assembly protein PilW
VQGYESDGAGAFSPALGLALTPAPVNDSDVVVVRTAKRDGRNTKLEASLASLSGNLSVTNTGSIAPGTVYMISNCINADFFQVSTWTTGTPATIAHATGGAITPGNSTDSFSYMYEMGSRLVPLETVVYYVGLDATTNEPGLYRQTGGGAPQLLIDGVQAMQVSYGEDTDNDRITNFYRSASAVVNWNAIISVNISVLIRSEEWGSNTDGNSYTMLAATAGGQTLGPYNDRRQRMMFTTTAALRNRAW